MFESDAPPNATKMCTWARVCDPAETRIAHMSVGIGCGHSPACLSDFAPPEAPTTLSDRRLVLGMVSRRVAPTWRDSQRQVVSFWSPLARGSSARLARR